MPLITVVSLGCDSGASASKSDEGSGTTTTEDNVPEGTSEVEEPIAEEQPPTVQFPSLDGLEITANVYEVKKGAPVILLCHQARYNKYEYDSIAPVLNEKGFNCVAIDQRSGGSLFGHENETFNRATEAGKATDYLDAEQDIIAAIDYTSERFGQSVILWGSSYSSTLALYQGLENDKVSAVISFSPGNYFSEEKGSLIEKLAEFKKPMFVTSSSEEAPELKGLLKEMELNEHQVQFEPVEAGYHGSKALWGGQPGGEEYWTAINSFLEQF